MWYCCGVAWLVWRGCCQTMSPGLASMGWAFVIAVVLLDYQLNVQLTFNKPHCGIQNPQLMHKKSWFRVTLLIYFIFLSKTNLGVMIFNYVFFICI
jgi:hypothetical protein